MTPADRQRSGDTARESANSEGSAAAAGVPDTPTAVAWAIGNGFEPGQSLAWYREAGGQCGAFEWHRAWLAELDRRAEPDPDQLELDL